MGVKLSALVCVADREAEIAECLRGLAFCDEIVVVADRAAEGPLEAARRAGAMRITGSYPLESQRRLAGLAACSGDWILEIEPDERVSSALAWEIRAKLKLGVDGDHFEARIENYLGDDLVQQGWTAELGETSAVRLYRPGAKTWAATRRDLGHAVRGQSAGVLKGAIRRVAGRDVNDLMETFNRRTALRAMELAEAAEPGRLAPAVLGGLGGFCNSYLVRSGWREGGLGLCLALLSGLYPVVSHLKAKEALGAAPQQASEPAAAYPRELVA